jgi:hypothetical protein
MKVEYKFYASSVLAQFISMLWTQSHWKLIVWLLTVRTNITPIWPLEYDKSPPS